MLNGLFINIDFRQYSKQKLFFFFLNAAFLTKCIPSVWSKMLVTAVKKEISPKAYLFPHPSNLNRQKMNKSILETP